MRTVLGVATLCLSLSLPAAAQEHGFQDALLDRLAGNWVLIGTIDGAESTHDIVSEWVLSHQYLRLHEVAREKDDAGAPAYEAIVFIGWDEPTNRYSCLWLDVTGGGGLSAEAIGHAEPGGDELAFVFDLGDNGVIPNTFAYNRDADTWQWFIDNEDGGERSPFARVTLSRASVQGPAAEVEAREIAFAKTMADRDLDAFLSFISPEAIFFAGNAPLRGHDEIARAWAPFFEGASAPFSWHPDVVEVLESGNLVLSSGPVHAASGEEVGRFNSIWRKEADGRWRVVFDKGS
jgi:ketosteroid isomerase-like protein